MGIGRPGDARSGERRDEDTASAGGKHTSNRFSSEKPDRVFAHLQRDENER
jgi:hypothetical protein